MAHPIIERFIYSRVFLSLCPADLLVQLASEDAESAFKDAEKEKLISPGVYEKAVIAADELAQYVRSRTTNW